MLTDWGIQGGLEVGGRGVAMIWMVVGLAVEVRHGGMVVGSYVHTHSPLWVRRSLFGIPKQVLGGIEGSNRLLVLGAVGAQFSRSSSRKLVVPKFQPLGDIR